MALVDGRDDWVDRLELGLMEGMEGMEGMVGWIGGCSISKRVTILREPSKA